MQYLFTHIVIFVLIGVDRVASLIAETLRGADAATLI